MEWDVAGNSFGLVEWVSVGWHGSSTSEILTTHMVVCDTCVTVTFQIYIEKYIHCIQQMIPSKISVSSYENAEDVFNIMYYT